MQAKPVVQTFDRYWTGSAAALPFDNVYAADYDAASDTIWAADSSGQIVRLNVRTGGTDIITTVSESGGYHPLGYGPRSLYHDQAIGKIALAWEEFVAVVDVSTGSYTITEMPGFSGMSDWYDYSTHTLFMALWADNQGLRSYNVETGIITAPIRPATSRIVGSNNYLMAHHPGGVSLWDHNLNLVRDFTDGVFPGFATYPGNPHWLSMTNDDLFAYGYLDASHEHQFYVGTLDPDGIIYDVNDTSYPLNLQPNEQMQNCYYSSDEHVLYVTISSIASEGLFQIDLDSQQVTRFGRPDWGYVRNVVRRDDTIVFYGEDGVFLSTQAIPEPATLSLLALGAAMSLARRKLKT